MSARTSEASTPPGTLKPLTGSDDFGTRPLFNPDPCFELVRCNNAREDVVFRRDPNSQNIWPFAVYLRFSHYGGPIRVERPINDESLARVVDLWKTDSPMTFREFWERYDDVARFGWAETQPYHTDTVGAWDDFDSETAASITYRIHAIALASLPYPPETILFAVGYVPNLGYTSAQMVSEWLSWIWEDARAKGETGLRFRHNIQKRFSDPVGRWARWARWGRVGWPGFCWRDDKNAVELPDADLPIQTSCDSYERCAVVM